MSEDHMKVMAAIRARGQIPPIVSSATPEIRCCNKKVINFDLADLSTQKSQKPYRARDRDENTDHEKNKAKSMNATTSMDRSNFNNFDFRIDVCDDDLTGISTKTVFTMQKVAQGDLSYHAIKLNKNNYPTKSDVIAEAQRKSRDEKHKVCESLNRPHSVESCTASNTHCDGDVNFSKMKCHSLEKTIHIPMIASLNLQSSPEVSKASRASSGRSNTKPASFGNSIVSFKNSDCGSSESDIFDHCNTAKHFKQSVEPFCDIYKDESQQEIKDFPKVSSTFQINCAAESCNVMTQTSPIAGKYTRAQHNSLESPPKKSNYSRIYNRPKKIIGTANALKDSSAILQAVNPNSYNNAHLIKLTRCQVSPGYKLITKAKDVEVAWVHLLRRYKIGNQ